MPRTRPLPECEQEICRRLIQFRQDRSISRAALARAMGLSRFTLASIEDARAALRFIGGYNLCNLYNLSLRWLATGRLPRRPFTPTALEILSKIGPRSLFSTAYTEHLQPLVDARLAELAEDAGVPEEELDKGRIIFDRMRLGASVANSHFESVLSFVSERAAEMDDARKIAFADELSEVGFKFWKLTESLESSKNRGENNLTDSATFCKRGGVKPQMPKLLERLKRAAAASGKRTELAEFLGAPLASVSRWLSEDREPGGEVALKMLHWVEAQERQNK